MSSSAAQWSATFDAMVDAVALSGSDGRVARANAAAAALAGLDLTR